MTQNLKKYPLTCPGCGGDNFARGTKMELGPNGLLNREGDYVCLECRQRLEISQALRYAEIARKQDELKQIQEEFESMKG